jgi:hypothetical protein
MEHDRRSTDQFKDDIADIKVDVGDIKLSINGNGKMGLKTRTYINWYGFLGLSVVITILTGCALFIK